MKNLKKNACLILTGSLCGAINGFFGGGGGMIAVPLLTFLLNLSPKVSHATSLAIILPTCVVSAILYCIFQPVDLKLTLFVTLGFVIGGVLGALLLKKLTTKWIIKLFAIIMLFAGIKLAFF